MDEATLQRMREAISSPDPQPTQQQPTPAPSSAATQAGQTLPNAFEVLSGMPAMGDTKTLGDIAQAALGAGRDALVNVSDTVNEGAHALARTADEHGLFMGPKEMLKGGPSPMAAILPEVGRADESTTGGSFINAGRDVGRFILGFIGTSLLTGPETAIGRVATSALGDFLVSGPNDPALSDFLTSNPHLKDSFLGALANHDGDVNWARKIEIAAEGTMAAGAIEGLVKLAGVLRGLVKVQREGDPAAIAKAVEEAKPELQQAYEDMQKEAPKPAEPPVEEATVKTNGDTFEHPETGPGAGLPLSDTARAEIKAATEDGKSIHYNDLTPETQAEIKDWIAKNPDALPPPPTPKYEPTFKLNEAEGEEFQKALQTSLDVPYATLRAENPGAALEDVLGNYFNYSKMTGPDEVKASLDSLAKMIAPKIDAEGGGAVQTHLHVAEMADWLGAKPDVLMGTLKQLGKMGVDTDMPALVRAGKIWMQSLTNDILKLVRMANAGLATDADKLKLAQMKDVLVDLVGLTKNVQRSAARTISAARMPTGPVSGAMEAGDRKALRKSLDDTTFKFVDNLLSLSDGSPKSLISVLEPTWGQKAMGILHEVWVNGVLGLKTQIVNNVGNARNTLLYPLYRSAGGVITGDWQSAKMGMAQYWALRNHIMDSAELASRAFKSNAPVLDTTAQQLEGSAQQLEGSAQQRYIRAGTFGLEDQSIFGTAINWLGNVIGASTRFLTTADEFFGQLNYRASVEARARIEAAQQGLSTKPTVEIMVDGEKRMISPADQYVRSEMEGAFNPKTGSGYSAEDGSLLHPQAMADSRRAKFTSPLKPDATWLGGRSIGEIVHSAANSNPFLAHFVAPFTKVPTNLFREMVNESPLAPIRKQFFYDFAQGGEARSDAMGRLALGSVFATGIGFMAAEGLVTGQGPSDPDRQRQWRAAGNVPYSFRLPGMGGDGKDAFIPYNRLDPMAGIVGIIADAQYIMGHVDEKTQNKIATSISMSIANNLNAKGYLQSMTDLMAVLKGARDGDSGGRLAQNWINSRLASYVPSVVSAFRSDDTIREVRGFMDAIQNRIPGLSEGLEPKYDNFGEPMLNPQGWPWREVNPFSLAVGKSGPARTEMNYWGEGPTATKFVMPHPAVGGAIDMRDYKNPQTGQSAYSRWMQLVGSPIFNGKTTEQDLDAFVQSDAYKELKKSGKEDPIYGHHPAAEAIRQQLDQHHMVAHDKMLSEPGFENLRSALQAYSVNKQAVPLGAPPMQNPTLQDLLNKK